MLLVLFIFTMNKLIILSGVPGSGKSYFSKTIKKIKNSHVYIVSSDELRKEIGANYFLLTSLPFSSNAYFSANAGLTAATRSYSWG